MIILLFLTVVVSRRLHNWESDLQGRMNRVTLYGNDTVDSLEPMIMQWRQDSYDMSQQVLKNLLNDGTCTCEGLTNNQRDQVQRDLRQIKNVVRDLKTKAENMGRCDRVDEVIRQTGKQLTFLDLMQEIIMKECSQFTSNLHSSGWILGGLAMDQLRQRYANGKRQCPVDKPFYNGRECINCPNYTPVFNMSSRQCQKCPQGTFLNNDRKQCLKEGDNGGGGGKWSATMNVNPTAERYLIAPKGYEKDPNSPNCPYEAPFYNGNACIRCEPPNYLFNISTKQCTSCPYGTTHNDTVKDCLPFLPLPYSPTGKYNTNPFARGLLLRGELQKDPSLPNCPLDRPYFNNTECIQCLQPHPLFNESTKQCTSCGPLEVYSPDSMSCEQSDRANNKPLQNSTSQITLSNLTSRFNWMTNDNNPARIYEQMSRMMKMPNVKLCPQGRQFYNGRQCISCQNGLYFNLDRKACESCPYGQKFSINMHRCVQPQADRDVQTNPETAPNLIYDGIGVNEYLKQYRLMKEKYPSIMDCPQDKPYYDGLSCISCPDPFRYFNLNTRQCQLCPLDSRYNKENRECQSLEGKVVYQGPTLEKMLASIFR